MEASWVLKLGGGAAAALVTAWALWALGPAGALIELFRDEPRDLTVSLRNLEGRYSLVRWQQDPSAPRPALIPTEGTLNIYWTGDAEWEVRGDEEPDFEDLGWWWVACVGVADPSNPFLRGENVRGEAFPDDNRPQWSMEEGQKRRFEAAAQANADADADGDGEPDGLIGAGYLFLAYCGSDRFKGDYDLPADDFSLSFEDSAAGVLLLMKNQTGTLVWVED